MRRPARLREMGSMLLLHLLGGLTDEEVDLVAAEELELLGCPA